MRVDAAAITVLLLLATPACEAEYGLTATEQAMGPSSPPTQPPSQLPPDGSAGGAPGGAPGGEIIAVDDSLLAPVVPDLEPAASTPSMPSMATLPPADGPTPAPIETFIEPALSAPPAPPADGPNEEGDLRLAGRVDINGYATGALHVFLDGAFGAVCVNEFGPADADVACRQMGFVGGTAVPLALRGAGPLRSDEVLQEIIAPFVLENLDCAGTEARLLDCPSVMEFERDYQYTTVSGGTYSVAERSGLTTCSALQAGYAFVACGMTEGPERGDLRLALGETSDDGDAQFGRLEIFDHGGWGSVCEAIERNTVRFGRAGPDAPVTDASVDVACRQLGFQGGGRIQIGVNVERSDLQRIPILLAGANCTGDEAALADCPGSNPGGSTTQCNTGDLVSLACFSNPDPEMEGRVRLMESTAGAGFEYGRLEIFIRGFWSSICDTESFTPDSAQVACRDLGFDGGAPLKFPGRSEIFRRENEVLVSSLPVGLASVDCDANATSLLQCTSSQNELRECIVEGTNLTDATVLACGTTAAGCPAPTEEEGALRLRGGFGTPCDVLHSGIVEIFHLGEWGAICFSRFFQATQEADVVCRQLGFPYGSIVDPSVNPRDPEPDDGFMSLYDPDEADEAAQLIWLNSFTCRGPEAAVLDCDIGSGFLGRDVGCPRGRGQVQAPTRFSVACRQFPIAEALEAVTTPGAEEGDLRLVGQSSVANWEMGRLEIFFEGAWGQVCALGFDDAAATVACRQLGFGAGATNPGMSGAIPAADQLVYPHVALTKLGCTGAEASLLECPGDDSQQFVNDDGCFNDDFEGLVIACVAEAEAGEEGALRLTEAGSEDDPAAGVGVLEIFHAGAWGTLCDAERRFDFGNRQEVSDSAGLVACRELGFEAADGFFTNVRDVPANTTLLPAWLAGLPCETVVPSLADCGLTFGNTLGCGSTQRLVCVRDDGSGAPLLEPRLVGGREDPAGAWAYGRLQVSDGMFFSSFYEDGRTEYSEEVGRGGVEVACQTLGFDTGAQLLSGIDSGLPGMGETVETIGKIVCLEGADTLADCTIEPDYFGSDYRDGQNAVAILCFNPSGCTVEDTPPTQGDVRLVNLRNSNFTTQPCDDVHFGGVEFFNDGRWGRICQFSARDPGGFAIDALVICRQLGFPFGSLMDLEEVDTSSGEAINEEDYPDEDEGVLVWATDVRCTGAEQRLGDCFFPEGLGNRGGRPGMPSPGLSFGRCATRDSTTVGVACRRFEIEESDVIRRL